MNKFKPSLPFFGVTLLTALLVGCASEPVGQRPEVEPSSYLKREDALGALLDEAGLARQAGKLNEAESRLSRAMRISPTSPEVYYQISLLRHQQGELAQAKQMVERALSLRPGRHLTHQLNQLLEILGG